VREGARARCRHEAMLSSPPGPALLSRMSPHRGEIRRYSPRASSPLDIYSDAKEFLAGSPPLLPRRKPSLDANKLPFGGDASPTTGDSLSSERPFAPPKRLPSLTMEEFHAMKQRTGLESRCSDPGAVSRSTESRGESRGQSRSGSRRRRNRMDTKHTNNGVSSAPPTRSLEVSEPLTPGYMTEPPLTEPAAQQGRHRRSGNSPFPRVCSEDSLLTPEGQKSKVSRPKHSRERRVFREQRDLSPASLANAASPQTGNSSRVPPTPGLGTSASASSLGRSASITRLPPHGEVATALRRSPPEPASAAPSVEIIARPAEPMPVGRLGLGAADAAGIPESQARLNAMLASAREDPSSVAAIVDSIKVSAEHDYWDKSYGSDPHANSGDSGPRNHAALPSTLTCTRGPRGGVMALSLSAFGNECSRDGGKMQATLLGTLSSPAAIHGGRFAWVRGDVLGHGSLGSVFKALDQRTGQMIAVKEVKIDQMDEHDVKFRLALENEVSICQDLKHPHIVRYLGHDYLDSRLYIYLEYMAGGSMAQVLSQFGKLDDSLIAVYTRGLLEGLEYLHTREPPVLHRDIKGANILVGLDCKVKFSDFGCSKRTTDSMSVSMRGSIPWMAPEVIKQTGYGRMADIWSFGCVLIEMGTAKHPWGHFDNQMHAMVRIGMSEDLPPFPEDGAKAMKDFIGLCVQRDKTKRPTARELLQHEFVRDILPE